MIKTPAAPTESTEITISSENDTTAVTCINDAKSDGSAAKKKEAATKSPLVLLSKFAADPTKEDPLFNRGEALLVVASLIAAAAFQAALSPPSRITQDKVTNPHVNCNYWAFDDKFTSYGERFRNCQELRIKSFMATNTLSFFSSILLIFFFHHPTFASILLEISVASLLATYLYVLLGISPSVATDMILLVFYLIAGMLVMFRMIFQIMKPLTKWVRSLKGDPPAVKVNEE